MLTIFKVKFHSPSKKAVTKMFNIYVQLPESVNLQNSSLELQKR